MIDKTKFEGYEHVIKAWGLEIILTNTPLYCAKFLIVDVGKQCSLHSHILKNETFLVLEGAPAIELGNTEHEALLSYHIKGPGDSIFVPAGTLHRFGAPTGPVTLLEISSHHDDSDVVRAQASGSIFPF